MKPNPKMLVIDDDEAFCQVLSRSLERHGLQVQIAHTAASALRLAAAFQPEQILLDLKLGADNGLQLIEHLRGHCPAARIVLATGYASIATAVEAVRRGAFNYLPKPFDLPTLLRAFDVAPEALPTEALPVLPATLRRQGWEHLQRVLSDNDGNISAAARVLGIDRRTLQRRLAKRPERERK